MLADIFGELDYTEKIEELARQDNRINKSQAIVVVRTDWAEIVDYFLDFYVVKEIDKEEGRISCESIACYQHKSTTWKTRTRSAIEFWVESFDNHWQSYSVSYVHPKDRNCVLYPTKDWAVGFCFNAPKGIDAAKFDTKNRRDPLKKFQQSLLFDLTTNK